MAAVSKSTQRLTIGDLDELWALDGRCFSDGEAYDRETFRELLASPNVLAFKEVAAEAVMIGFILGIVEADGTGHIVVLGVSPEWRRQGIARGLLREADREFVARGITTTHLEVRTTNVGARRLYEEMGFAVAGRRLSYYSNGDDGYLMVKTA